MTSKQTDPSSSRNARGDRTASAYRAALDRLIRGVPRHPTHVGQTVRLTPTAVAREAGRSRNPLYTTHRAILEEIVAAAAGPTPAKGLAEAITGLKATIAELRAHVSTHAEEKRALATENLALLHRARVAEDMLAVRDRELEERRPITSTRSAHRDDQR